MGKRTERDITPEDTKDWPDAIIGQPFGGPGSPGRPPPGKGKKRPKTFGEEVNDLRKRTGKN